MEQADALKRELFDVTVDDSWGSYYMGDQLGWQITYDDPYPLPRRHFTIEEAKKKLERMKELLKPSSSRPTLLELKKEIKND